CGKGWKGNRCHISAKPLQPPTSSPLQNENQNLVSDLQALITPVTEWELLEFIICYLIILIDYSTCRKLEICVQHPPALRTDPSAQHALAPVSCVCVLHKLLEFKGVMKENQTNPCPYHLLMAQKGYAISSAVQISVSPWHEYPFNENVNATSFPNPLYGVAAEDMEK
ncbi:hypothetical protein EK904_005767, partial [Melospiza melodia maxima]